MSEKSLNLSELDIKDFKRFDSYDSAIQSLSSDSFYNNEVNPKLERYLKEFEYNYERRPTVEVLHRCSLYSLDCENNEQKKSISNEFIQIDNKDKFGYLSMVYVPTFMNLLGTAMYLRMGFMAAECGIRLIQVLIGTLILCGTVLSISALCTNGEMGPGGFYYLISRNLGPEIGAMFGVIYFLTNAIMVAFSIVGVCLEIQYILQSYNVGIVEMHSGVNDQRIVGLITLIVISFIPFISLDFEAKSQWFLFGIVILSVLDFIIGELIPPNAYQKVHGFVGWKTEVIASNLMSHWKNYSFFSMFSVFFSSLCGDFTGVTMAKHLRNPAVAIPKGSVLAIISSTIIYSLQIILMGCTVLRNTSGNLSDLTNNNYTCDSDQNCDFGLSNDQYLMSKTCALTTFGYRTNYIEPIFAAGILAVSLSSAMSSFITAPRILQSLGYDRLLPKLIWFSKAYGKHADPRRGYVLTFIIALIFIAVANFDIIANIMSICYLFAWFLLNVACFHSDYVKSSNWRPTFKFYNKWLSLLCGIVCFILMFCFDWISSLVLLAIITLIWVIMYLNKTDTNWGQTTDSQLYKTTVSFAHKLNLKSEHVKNFRPSVLLLSGIPNNYTDLISMANEITRHRGMLVIGDVVNTDVLYENRSKTTQMWNKWLNDHNIKCFYRLVVANSVGQGSNMLIQCSGLGSYLSPNIVMIGFRESWKQCSYDEVIDYFNIIHHSFQMQKSLIIYRNHRKSKYFIEKEKIKKCLKMKDPLTPRTSYQKRIKGFDKLVEIKDIRALNKLDFIDIYWLYDDGGLTLLIPYILTKRKDWKKCKLRVFVVIDSQSIDSNAIYSAEQNLTLMLKKFRINYYDIITIELPERSVYQSIEDIKSNFEDIDNSPFNDIESKLEISNCFDRFESKTNKYLSLRELIEKHSKDSSLIVMTIEIPMKDILSSHIFMYWLDMLSAEMPKFLFIRGNQNNVFTFYCD